MSKQIEIFRNNALKQFKETPLQDRKHGLGIKTRLDWVELKDFGKGDLSLQKGHAKILSQKEFLSSDNSLIQEARESLFKYEGKKEKIDYLHYAKSNIYAIHITESSDDPIIINQVLNENSLNHVFVIVEKNVNADVLISTFGENITGTSYTQILCGEGAKISISIVKDMKNSYLHCKNQVLLKKDTTSHLVTADFGSKLIVNESTATLVESASDSRIDTLFFGLDEEEFDISSSSIHANKNTKSLLNSKGALQGSKVINRGLVQINSNAPDSNGYQKSDILLLDEKAHAVSIPDLLIHNDQVACSHGSTISNLEEEKVFYLQSRGLSKQQAEKKLVEGFFFPILEDIRNEEITEFIHEKIMERINR